MYRALNYFIPLLITTIFFIFVYFSEIIDQYDLKIYDLTTFILGVSDREQVDTQTSNIVIVNIDNKSINQMEQWPWSRVIYAQLISNINEMTPATIGFNMNFCHKDKSSPIVIKKFYQKYFDLNNTISNIPKELENNDRFLGQKLFSSKSVLSLRMSNSPKKTASHCDNLSYNILENIDKIKYLPQASYLECNTKDFHHNNPNFGFNTIPLDIDGVAREIPLLRKYKDRSIPSFGLAILLSLNIHDYDTKEKRLSFFDKSIFLESRDRLLLPYRLSPPNVFSAIDVLKKQVPKEAFHGKIVIVGSTTYRFNGYSQIYHDEKVDSSTIHAQYIESLFNHTFLVQSDFYKKINILSSFFFSILLYIFFKQRWSKRMVILTGMMTLGSFVWLFVMFNRGVYVSIGYLWIPTLISYIVLFIVMFFSKNKKEKEALKEDLARSFHSTATSMALVANTHDQETGEHLIRTKKYVKLLAKQLYKKGLYSDSLYPHRIELISEAAPLHDIGKVGISDSILKKPGKLTFEEFEIMKTHSQLGANIIEQSLEYYDHNPLLNIAYNIALYHHERWDGNGYPNGLKENEIPIEAQLMTIADVYDALISKRRYKEAFTYDKAESIIISERGKAFSPILVDIFIEQKEKFKSISMEWHEEKMA